jgi:hypothetical protein
MLMDPTKLKAIRKQVRPSFHMTDAELSNWLDSQVEERRRMSGAAEPVCRGLYNGRYLRLGCRPQHLDRPRRRRLPSVDQLFRGLI